MWTRFRTYRRIIMSKCRDSCQHCEVCCYYKDYIKKLLEVGIKISVDKCNYYDEEI